MLTGDFAVLTKMYTKVCSVNFHMSYFHMFCFLAIFSCKKFTAFLCDFRFFPVNFWGVQSQDSRKIPVHFFILMGPKHSFLEHFCFDQSSLFFRANSTCRDFPKTSFGRTLLGSKFGGLWLEEILCRHFAAFPQRV